MRVCVRLADCVHVQVGQVKGKPYDLGKGGEILSN
jgi:hypothetical protein